MKKILFGIFAVILLVPGAYSDDIDLNDTGALDAQINVYALRDALREFPKKIEETMGDCYQFFIEKGRFMDLVQKEYRKHKQITLSTIQSSCLKKGSAYAIPMLDCKAFDPSMIEKAEYEHYRQGEVCFELMFDVVEKHNQLVVGTKEPFVVEQYITLTDKVAELEQEKPVVLKDKVAELEREEPVVLKDKVAVLERE